MRTIMLLSFVCMMALSVPSNLLAGGGKGDLISSAMGTWVCTTDDGAYMMTASASPTVPSARSWVVESDFIKHDPTMGGFFPNAAPVHPVGRGEGFRTGRDKFENYIITYFKNMNGSLAYILISRSKVRMLDADNMKGNAKSYIFIAGLFTDADGDGVPDDYSEAVLADEGSNTCKRLYLPISSFPVPDEYPDKP